MGQYFKIVNLDKREVVNPWDLGTGAKFWEWLYNPHARVFVWLLRKSDGDGGGDIHDRDQYKTLGRWAGDRLVLIGDYDSSRLYEEASNEPVRTDIRPGGDDEGNAMEQGEYTDITKLLRQEFNAAVKKDTGRVEDTL